MIMRHKVRVLMVAGAVMIAILKSNNFVLSMISILVLVLFLVVSLLAEHKINEV